MPRSGRSRSLTDTKWALHSRGEIAVGAFAAQQRRRRIMLGVFGLLLIGGALTLYFAIAPDNGTSQNRLPLLVECLKCGERSVVQVRPDTPFPLPCPACGERACQKLWECRACGERFIRRNADAGLQCPNCGSRNVGTARPETETETETDGG